MAATIALPDVATIARRARDISATWAADEDMPDVAGCAEDAVRIFAIRAAVLEETKDEDAAALPAPAVVELTARLLAAQFPELDDVAHWSGHAIIHGAEGARWEPGDYVYQAYTEAFGPAAGRHWAV